MKKKYIFIAMLILGLSVNSCVGDSSQESNDDTSLEETTVNSAVDNQQAEVTENSEGNKGIGPITSVTLGEEVDNEMANAGMKLYKEKCSACHKAEEKYIGPAPKGILERRTPEWVMNMILNPVEMVNKDSIAKKLLEEYNGSPMANMGLSEEEARSVLEYFRTL